MAGYEAGAPELKQAAKQMEDANANLQGQLSKLASEVEGIAGSWRGDAHTAFQTLMGRFAEDAKKLNDSLVQIAEQVSLSSTEYEQQEAQANQSLSQITNILGS
jgi:WXG100 family type VII secretion target